MKKVSGIVLVILGALLFLYGSHTAEEAAMGEGRISEAESSGGGGHRPILGPVRRHARNEASESAQGRLNAAELRVSALQLNANWLRGAGVVLFAVGIGCLVLSFRPRHYS